MLSTFSYTRSEATINKKLISMLYPVCRLTTPIETGSGVFISNTLILTVFHSLKDAITSLGLPNGVQEIRHPITCEVFPFGKVEQFSADIYAYDEAQDIALLKLKSGSYEHFAQLIALTQINALNIFDDLYTVGASLGHEPIPTKGILTYKKEELGFGKYWMTDAHILLGNSGGGVFITLDNKYYLIGLTTSLMVDEENNQTHITHFIPPDSIHNFLNSLNLD